MLGLVMMFAQVCVDCDDVLCFMLGFCGWKIPN